jgi:import inner membrane translocase subunit TIM13
MSFLGGSAASSSASQTQAIKQQVAQEAAVANARQLVEVRLN